MEYFSLALVSLILLTLGAVLSLKTNKGVLIACIIALLIMLSAPSASYSVYVLFVLVIAFLNLFSLGLMKDRQIIGVDYSLVALMAFATVYVLYTQDLALILATFVLVSVPTYILVMMSDRSANVNVGIKYITFMVVATVLFLIGSLILVFTYHQPNDYMYIVGYTLLVLGLCLEVGCAPLHEWVPDVFAGANPIPVSIIASLAKIVPFVVAYKILITTTNPLIVSISLLTAFIAAISMLIGNIGALTARELNRVLGYSTVANMGYILATLVVLVNLNFVYLAFAGAFLQLIMNSVGKIGFFSSIKSEGSSTPLMYLLALSFIGLPPLMGFWSKFFIVLALVGVGYVWLAVVLVLNAAISVPYYLRLAGELGREWSFSLANGIALVASVVVLITIIPPYWLESVIRDLLGYLQLTMGG
jgi:NADH-quinone oxidoreductase subunit N